MLGSQHFFRIKKEELAQSVAACEFDPEVVRSGKEGLFEKPYYTEIFDGRPAYRYLSAYWLSRVVKYNASGYPNRAYAKWHVLHFLWSRLDQELNKRPTADAFRSLCERNRWGKHLDDATRLTYSAALDFYRRKRGKGATAVDISNFFYRSKQHINFERFWKGAVNRRRGATTRAFRAFLEDIRREAQRN